MQPEKSFLIVKVMEFFPFTLLSLLNPESKFYLLLHMIQVPDQFVKMIESLLGKEEARKLILSLDLPPVTSIRINRRKPIVEFDNMTPVPWCDSGFYLEQRPEFIFDPLMHAGAYYVQDASSMIYETIMEQIVEKFRKESSFESAKLKVLDLCAAPGGKTTAMLNALPDGSEMTANEYSRKRVEALRENIDRWGYPLVKVTNYDSFFYSNQVEIFDVVAVDAPCSGEGMMRKEEMARQQWNPELVHQCSLLQREILKNAVKALKPGGFLIYSTCTFNREENELNAEFIKNELNLLPIDLGFPSEWGIMQGIETDLPVYRFMPHKTRGEGLFVAVFKKTGEWQPSGFNNEIFSSLSSNSFKNIPLKKDCKDKNREKKGQNSFKRPRLASKQRPFNETIEKPLINVDKASAIKYLQGESIVLPPESPLGSVTIAYRGLPLGEAKNIGSRANNLFPKHRRILKR